MRTPLRGRRRPFAGVGTLVVPGAVLAPDPAGNERVVQVKAGSNVTVNTTDPGQIVISATGGGGGGGATLIGVQRVLGDGVTTAFDLLDFAEYLIAASDNGSIVDPTLYSLSADRSQIVFSSAPTAGHVLVILYVNAQLP